MIRREHEEHPHVLRDAMGRQSIVAGAENCCE